MDIKQIQELVKLVNKSGISELQVKEGEFEITIKTGSQIVQSVQHVPYVQQAAPQQVQATTESSAEAPVQAAPTVKEENATTFRSPMIGTFIANPAPTRNHSSRSEIASRKVTYSAS
jgi:acetyl-CoA carboxylase biotin carboxyl carrier protein